MDDTFTFTLDDETEKRLFDMLTDMDVSKSLSFSIKDKHGNEGEYVKAVRCKDCIHFKPFVENDGMWCDMLEIDLGENGFCSLAERKEE